ncbi:inhibitor of Bruton tyrosine kinase [Parasteatoda tepidariorum]|uniref:inhibitor of Bruton tyrosine kinase n=1 Tax=Parasteatoda tepidariorum TaxID=114398 RepID=UPI00077FC28E|nr:uncharacterized protein LOC107449085 [Parasteatoda tepidariorum]XP_042908953.1 uncharacterized protein LOC107449085 [Parasteatoda tepidariorum]XP_042908954.1 uncharacterized protein LOC107449085 [Parasteatoda tepidariorum]XP_042908955.1 uncharacterized protein LOC107449085 [Parasteatoda tepidariorum]XP_042908956.1 uncharacterized protein LOC107449085 [Parasteatoda tepidariorum]
MATAAAYILEFFQSNKHFDLTFKVKCGSTWSSFTAHKIVLSIWSPVWAKKFQENSNAVDDVIEILDISPSVFHAFLSYLYGSKKELEESKNDVKFVLSIYEAACKYRVQRLKTHCCEILNSSSPNKNNVFELLDAAVLINSDCLKGQCFKVLQSETEEILNSQDITSVTPTMVETLLQLPSLWLSSENDLLTWVFKWAKSYCSLQNINIPSKVISPFLPFFNFTALNSKEFAMLVSDHKEFFDEVECFNIFMKINLQESSELPANANSRSYMKPTETPASAMLGDGTPEMPYAINNSSSRNSDSSNYNASSTASISTSTEETVPAVNVGTNATITVDNGPVNCYITADKETMTDLAIDTSSASCCTILMPSADKETMTDLAMDTEAEILPNDISLQSSADNTDDVTMDTKDDAVTSSSDNSSVQLQIEASNDTSSAIEMTERGQSNNSVLEVEDPEPGISWEFLEPPLHLEKIKKKKIVKAYLLPEGKSLPNIGKWDPEFEDPLKSRDIKSLNYIIQKQRCHTVATEKSPSTIFPFYARFLST